MMRSLPADFDPAIVTAIDGRLDAIVASGVAIPLAVESGSRAWGFPSPDSLPPMHFPTLVDEGGADAGLQAHIAALLRSKAATRELGETPPAGDLLDFADAEIAAALAATLPAAGPDAAARNAADTTLRVVLNRWAPASG